MPDRAGRNRNRDPYYYWNHTASTKPEARALATPLGLNFPIKYPIRRLIVTGENNPTELASLLGPLWETKAGEIIEETRIEVLLCPPPGSPDHMVSKHLDVGSPHYTPPAPHEKEEIELEKFRDMEQRVAGQLGERKDVETKDINDILMRMGGNWASCLGPLQAAINGTAQGVMR